MAAIIPDRANPQFCEPVSLARAKAHLRVIDTSQDDLIGVLISAAREYAETFTARSFINKGFIQMLDCFPYYTDSAMSQQAYPPNYYSLPRYASNMWNYSQMIKLFQNPLASVDHILYMAAQDGLPNGAPTPLLVAPMPWFPLEYHDLGDEITDSNGNIQVCIKAGESALTPPPVWGLAGEQFNEGGFGEGPYGGAGETDDGTVKWLYVGPAPETQFIFDDASEPPRIFPLAGQTWPPCAYVPNSVRIHYVAGYNNDALIAVQVQAWANKQSPAPSADELATYEATLRQDDVPQAAMAAMLAYITYWYENREAVSPTALKEAPKMVDMLLWSLRVLDAAPTRG